MKIDGESLTVNDVVAVARFGENVSIDESCMERVKQSREVIERILNEKKTVYGINTGLGDLVKVRISPDELKKLQINLVRSHSAGVGAYLPEEVVRGAMLIRANSLLKGHSGVRPEVIELLINMLNKGIVPAVPMYGSVGASGDLAPMAHIALAMMGEGNVFYRGEIMSAEEAMEREGLTPLELKEKEGLAILNGTSVMASYASLAVHDSYNLVKNSLVSAAMSFEALRGTDAALDERIMKVRPHPGQIRIAENLRKLLEDSTIVKSARKEKVQDAYTLRCIPQVYGAVLDAIDYVRTVVEREINSVTDNPIVFDSPISGGNFHGEPLALALDFLGIAITDLGNMIERRIARLVDSSLSGLPHFLIENSGLNSGFMIPQYTAAALCNRNKTLAHPASADTIPTSANQEDHVSMGMNAAIKAAEIIENTEYIVAIELLCANQALHLSAASATAVKIAQETINIDKIEEDTVFTPLIEKLKKMVKNGDIVRAVEERCPISL